MDFYQPPKINFRRQRDFGQLFTDVFKFIKLNFKSLFLCMLLIPGPLLIIAGGFNGYLQSINADPARFFSYGSIRNPMDAIAEMMGIMLPYIFFAWLAALTASATVNRFFVLYQQKETNNSIEVSEIIRYLPGDVWRLFYNGLLLGLVMVAVVIAIVIIAMIPVLGILALIVGILLLGPPLYYALVSGNYLVIRDRILITSAVSKAWKYMRGNFWWTWLIVVVSTMMVGIMGFIFGLPMAIMQIIDNPVFNRNYDGGESNLVLYVILGIIATIGPQLLSPITVLFNVLAYHSYEETEEGSGLKDKIDEITLDS